MEELKAALLARLSGDAELQQLAPGGVHSLAAPESTTFPYVLVKFLASRACWALQQKVHEDFTVQTLGVDEGLDQAAVEAIKTRLRELLDDQPLTVSGHTVWQMRCTGELADCVVVEAAGTRVHAGLEFVIRLAGG